MESQVLQDLEEFKSIYPGFPQAEYTKEKVIIRNVPNCNCYKKLAKAFLVASGICEKEADIQMFESGICIAKRKKCNCGSEKK